MKFSLTRFGLVIVWGLLISACQRIETPSAPTRTPLVEVTRAEITPTPRVTATPTRTLTPTATPTPTFTPTPTATAIPISVSGDPLAALVAEPVPQPGAMCGFVDYFDFPIDPPDADLGRGGGDFGVYRQRYQSNHAGEDWGVQNGENLGTPVHVIGHGVVTYSQPYGWGLDQGTVIVMHTFRNGRTVYSFYGHLDPPSVTLRPGDCLARGETVGNIGDPTGRPHLHFEIRLHNPDTPGPGYWPVDPTLAGWLPPSQTIWENRIEGQAGTVWTRVPAEGTSTWVGQAGETLLVVEESELRALSLSDGHVIWRQELETNFPTVLLSAEAGVVYLADPLGRLEALILPTPEMMATWNNTKVELDRAWEQDLEVNGSPTLMPLPDGGVVMAFRQTTVAFSAEGDTLWEAEGMLAISGWVLEARRVVFSTEGNAPAVWAATEEGLELLAEGVGGQVAEGHDGLFIYNFEGVYRWDEGGLAAQVYAFGRGSGTGNIVPSPEGGVLIVHPDRVGTRVLAFDAAGKLVWERALRGVVGQVRAIRVGERVFLLAEVSQSSAAKVFLYQVDLVQQALLARLVAGTRTAARGSTWIEALNPSQVVLQIGGGHQVLFDASLVP